MGKPNRPSYKIPPSIKAVVNFNLDRCGNWEKIIVIVVETVQLSMLVS